MPEIKVNKRVIGETFPEERVFRKKVQKSKHLFRKLNAWGIDADFFYQVLLPQLYTIEVLDKEEKALYFASSETVAEHGTVLHFKGEEDHRSQIFLPLQYFEKRLLKPA